MPHPYPFPEFKPLFELSATVGTICDLGETPQGHRMMAVVGRGNGTVSGNLCWQGHPEARNSLLLRPNGAGQVDFACGSRPTTTR